MQVGAALGEEAGEIVATAIAEGQRLLDADLLDPLFNAITTHLEGILKQVCERAPTCVASVCKPEAINDF